MDSPTVLIFGRDKTNQLKIKPRLQRHGFKIIEVHRKSEVIKTFETHKPDLIFVYSSRRGIADRLRTIELFRRKDRFIPIILTTKYSSEKRAVAALRAGVNDYFKLPVASEDLMFSAKKLLLNNSASSLPDRKNATGKKAMDQTFVGESKPIKEVKSYLLKVAKADSTVLITGETGTGKELAAGLVHSKSPRNNKPLVCINCAAMPAGLVESELFGYERGAFTGAVGNKKGMLEIARGGTVFLDEIGDMNFTAQAKILRSIENKDFFHLGGRWSIPMEARVIAATNQDPELLMAQGNFRKDLYYRLNVARVNLPPLRERKEDIPLLVDFAIRKLNRQFNREVEGFTDSAMAAFYRYDWPGNVRELFNLLEAAFINLPSRPITRIDLPKPIQKKFLTMEAEPMEERSRILSALLDTNWNKSSAARNLEWSRMTLYRKMDKYNIVETRKR